MIASRLALAAALVALSVPAAAQTLDSTDASAGGATEATAAETSDTPTPGNADNAHHDHSDDIVVTGIRRKANDVLGGISVLDEADLTREMRTSIGETLARQPGVSATSFGPTASAPVLRGLSGDRVRVLTDGIGSLDLSSSGPDHAIAINPITAERIEVLRGPSALLFGSSAIGGVVNVIDTRIPRHLPENSIGVNALAGYGTAANERLVNGSVDVPVAGHFVFHVDGNWQKSDDLDIGGHVLSKELREQALASPDPDIRALADLKGELPNSARRVQGRRDRLRLCRWRTEHRRVRHSPPRDLPGADPLFARPVDRARSADDQAGTDSLRLPRGNSAQRLPQSGPRSRRLCELSS